MPTASSTRSGKSCVAGSEATFTAAELADCYGQGTEWSLQLISQTSPSITDAQALTDAAFWLYLQGASDYSGGRRLVV